MAIMTDEIADEMLNFTEVAKLMNVHRTTVQHWCDRGWMKSVQYPSGKRRVRRSEVERFLEDQKGDE